MGFALRVWLIYAYPIIYGGDTILRMARSDRMQMSYQLPLLQVVIHVLAAWSPDPLLLRYWMALVGALAGLGFYLLVTELYDRRIAFYAALIFASHPFLVALSVVPFQEVPTLAGLLFAFYFAFRDRWLVASLCLALACLTRYDAWIACPVLALDYFLRNGRTPRSAIAGATLFGWAPAAWMLYSHGLSPQGTWVLDRSITIWRFERWAYLGWITLKYTPIPVLLLTLVGVWRLWRDRDRWGNRTLCLGLFFALYLVAVLLEAHGEVRDAERFVGSREAYLLVAAVLVIASAGFAQWRRAAIPFVVLGVTLGAWGARGYLARETSQPDTQLAYRLAQMLDRTVGPGERVLILANPHPDTLMNYYFDKVRQTGGEGAVRTAEQSLAGINSWPLEVQRTMVHSRLARGQFASLDYMSRAQNAMPAAEWIAAWSDFHPLSSGQEQAYRFAFSGPDSIVKSGPLSVAIRRARIPGGIQP